jgi:spermidine synthase
MSDALNSFSPALSLPILAVEKSARYLHPMGRFYILFLMLILSTISVLYEMNLASMLSLYLEDSSSQYAIVIGLYLLALGAGAYSIPPDINSPLKKLLSTEILLSLAGVLSPIYILSIASWLFEYSLALPLYYIPVLIIGYYSGKELPLLLKTKGADNFATILSVSYFGSLLASLLFALFLFPNMEAGKISAIAAICNLLAAALIAFSETSWRYLSISALLPISLFLFYFSNLSQNFYKNAFESYVNTLWENVTLEQFHQFQTSYQTVTEVKATCSDRNGKKLYSERGIFLDRELQFSESSLNAWHSGFALSHLLYPVEHSKILILGGGDGFLASRLLKSQKISHVDIVELDPDFSEFMKNHPFWSQWNETAFNDPRVEWHFDDASSWTRVHMKSNLYNTVLMDLASINTRHKSLSLYSKEMFASIRNSLILKGVFCLWIYESETHRAALLSTAKAAGFRYYQILSAFSIDSLYQGYYSKKESSTILQDFLLLCADKPQNKETEHLSSYEKTLVAVNTPKWLPIPHSNVAPNSIFRPNRALAPQKRVYIRQNPIQLILKNQEKQNSDHLH